MAIRSIQGLRVLLYRLLSTAHTTGRAEFIQPALVLGSGRVVFGSNVKLGFFPSAHFLSGYCHVEARGRESLISIGDDTHINNNFVAIADHKSIEIGKRCFIGTSVEVYDSDFHGIGVSERRESRPERAESVSFGDDVFIGSSVTVLKGVRIGSGSVIAAGSVVVGDIPSNVIAGGNPARVVRELD